MQFGLILTLDYEIFGNGQGSVRKHVIDPTSRILKICNEYDFKLTIMFEVCEYWSFKRAEEKGLLNHLDYSPSSLMEEQIKEAISQGHDVQLHIHPQWINSDYENKIWNLNHKFGRLSDIPYEGASQSDVSIISLLNEGKKTLENLLKEVDSQYECIAFRAGSWCIQPESEIIKAMKNLGFIFDSSVFKGGFRKGRFEYDYRNAPYGIGYWWTKKNSVCGIGKSGENIVESPIYATHRPFYYNLKWSKLKAILSSRFQSRSHYSSGESNGFGDKYNLNPFRSYPFKLDFCKLGFRDMENFIERAFNTKFPDNNTIVPIVAIGHSKNFNNSSNLEKFLHLISTKYDKKIQTLTFRSLGEIIRKHG